MIVTRGFWRTCCAESALGVFDAVQRNRPVRRRIRASRNHRLQRLYRSQDFAYLQNLWKILKEKGLPGEPLIMQAYGGVLGLKPRAKTPWEPSSPGPRRVS